MPRRSNVPARNRRVERLAEAIVHARRQELRHDLGWLFTSEPQDADIEETSNLVRQVDKMAKGIADVPCVLGRESGNLIELDGVTKGSADVHCVLGRESANLIGLEGVAKGSADVPCVLGRESVFNLIGLELASSRPRNRDTQVNISHKSECSTDGVNVKYSRR